MPKFKVVSEYTPSGDQPQAIEKLAAGLEAGLRQQVLLGVTGSGKTYTCLLYTSSEISRQMASPDMSNRAFSKAR